MDDDKSSQFVVSLVKSIQALCNGYIDFNSTVEVIGHIHLNIDCGVKIDYVLTEEINKSPKDDSTLFTSHSYYSKPPSQLQSQSQKNSLPPKSSSRRKSALVPREIDSESEPFTCTPYSSNLTTCVINAAVSNTQKSICGDSGNSAKLQLPSSLAKGVQRKTDAADTLCSFAKRFRNEDPARSTLVRASEYPDVVVKQEQDDSSYYNDEITHSVGSELDSESHAAVSENLEQQPFPLMLHVNANPPSEMVSMPSSSGVVAQKLGVWVPGQQLSSLVNLNLKNVTLIKGRAEGLISGANVIRYVMKDGQLIPLLEEQHANQLKSYIKKEKDGKVVDLPADQKETKGTKIGITTEMEKILSTNNDKPDVDLSRGTVADPKKNTRGLKIVFRNIARKSTTASKTVRKTVPDNTGFHSRQKSTMKAKASLNKMAYDPSGYMEYTDEDINAAIELVHKGMPVIDAALKYGIPRASLFNRSRAGCRTHSGRCSEVFSESQSEFVKKRKHLQYSQDAVEKAIDAIHKGMPVIDASFLFKIPRASLFIRSGKGCPSHTGRCSTVYSHGRIHRTKVHKHKYLELIEMSKSHDLSNKSDGKAKIKVTRKRRSKLSQKQKTKSSQNLNASAIPMLDPSTGKFVHIPLKVVSVDPLNLHNADGPKASCSQAVEEPDSEHEFETLTTSDSNLVIERLKERLKNNSFAGKNEAEEDG